MLVTYREEIIYKSQPRQTIFHEAIKTASIDRTRPRNLLYGGAAGGGKTEALLWEIWRWGNNPNYPGLSIAVFRKTIPEVEKYFVDRLFKCFPNPPENKIWKYNSRKRILKFLSTGTTVEFNSCENDIDVTKYQGAQWDILIIDELTHHSEYVYKYLRTRNRLTKEGMRCGFRPLSIFTTNPGGIGHNHTKRLFVTRNDYKENEGTADDYLFIPAKIQDNQALMQSDPEYIQNLMALPEMDRRALLDGDWDIFAGQYFGEIRREIHSFPAAARPPYIWPHFIALDYGFFPHPASVGWYAVGPDGTLWRYRELLVQRHTFSDLAKKIISMTPSEERESIKRDGYVVVSPDIFAKRGLGEGKSGAEEIAEEFDNANLKWLIIPADNDRINGWRIMRGVIKPYLFGEEITAKLKVSELCINWWTSVPAAQHDPNRPEDVRKVGVTQDGRITDGDDCADETRYAIMSRYEYNPKQEEEKRDRYGAPIKTKKKSKYQGFQEPPKYQGVRVVD